MSINKYNSTSGQLERIDGIIATDATPISESINPVQSGGVYTALASKQNILTFDTTPTNASSNPVTSGGLYTALGTKANESMIGDAYSSSKSYAKNEYCIANNILYRSLVDNNQGNAVTDTTRWAATDTATEITALNNSLTVNYGSEINLLPRLKDATHDIYGNTLSEYTISVSGTQVGQPYMVLQPQLTHAVGWVSNAGNSYFQLEATYPISTQRISAVIVSSSTGTTTHSISCAVKVNDAWQSIGSTYTFTLASRYARYFYFDVDYTQYPVIYGIKISDSPTGTADMHLTNLTAIPY